MAAQLQSTFGIDPSEIIHISAKTGQGVEAVLGAIVDRIPPPSGNINSPLKAFMFDSLSVYVYLSFPFCGSSSALDMTATGVSFPSSAYRTASFKKVGLYILRALPSSLSGM